MEMGLGPIHMFLETAPILPFYIVIDKLHDLSLVDIGHSKRAMS